MEDLTGRNAERLRQEREQLSLAKDEFLSRLNGNQADPGLLDDLRRMLPDTTDDDPIP